MVLGLESQPLHSHSQQSDSRPSQADGQVFDIDDFIGGRLTEEETAEEEGDQLLNGGLSCVQDAVLNPAASQPHRQAEQKLLDASRGSIVDSCLPGQVLLHVYDLNEGFQKANEILAFSLDSIAVGGAFHVGVEVFGSEWSFGCCGVRCALPRAAQGHVYNSSISLGCTKLEKMDFVTVLHQLCKEWRGASYHIFARNCCSFATELCRRLGTEEVPAWITRLPRLLNAGRIAIKEGQKVRNQAIDTCRMAVRLMAKARSPTRSNSKVKYASKSLTLDKFPSEDIQNTQQQHMSKDATPDGEGPQRRHTVSFGGAEEITSLAGCQHGVGADGDAGSIGVEPIIRSPSLTSIVSMNSARSAPLPLRCMPPRGYSFSLQPLSQTASNVVATRHMLQVLPTAGRRRRVETSPVGRGDASSACTPLIEKLRCGYFAPTGPPPLERRRCGYFSPRSPSSPTQQTGAIPSTASDSSHAFYWQPPDV